MKQKIVKTAMTSVSLSDEQEKFVTEYAQANGISFDAAIEHMVCFFSMCVYTQRKNAELKLPTRKKTA